MEHIKHKGVKRMKEKCKDKLRDLYIKEYQLEFELNRTTLLFNKFSDVRYLTEIKKLADALADHKKQVKSELEKMEKIPLTYLETISIIFSVAELEIIKKAVYSTFKKLNNSTKIKKLAHQTTMLQFKGGAKDD